MTSVSLEVSAPDSLLLLVGREDFSLPSSLGGATCTASEDCLVVAVRSPYDGPTRVSFAAEVPRETTGLVELGAFELEAEGLLSLRDVYQRELGAAGVEPGIVTVTVHGDAASAPAEVVLVIPGRALGRG